MPIRDIARIYDLSHNTVHLCVNKYLDGDYKKALFDEQREGRPVEITDDAIAWIINLACQRPADLEYERLMTITKPMLQDILKKADIKPFKIKYYYRKEESRFCREDA